MLNFDVPRAASFPYPAASQILARHVHAKSRLDPLPFVDSMSGED
jgi:hypothetical protein